MAALRAALLAVLAAARVLEAVRPGASPLRTVLRSPAPRVPVATAADAGSARLAKGSDRPRGASLRDVVRSSRRAVLALPALAPAAAHAAFGAAAASLGAPDPQRRAPEQAKWLEEVRALQQDLDNLSSRYDGELAPGGPRRGVPALLLVPILQLRQRLGALGQDLRGATVDEARWRSVGAALAASPFETLELKRTFNAYSDNIYYATGSAEANAYLLGGSTPSTSQTTQYLLRNEFLKHVAECREEIAYQLPLAPEQREVEVAQEALAAAVKDLDEYLSLAPREELAAARGALGEK